MKGEKAKMVLYENLGTCHPSLKRGIVWCTKCGRSQKVNSGLSLQNGWPECCGYTMTIDSPEERRILQKQRSS